jgi:hypothetical protein
VWANSEARKRSIVSTRHDYLRFTRKNLVVEFA